MIRNLKIFIEDTDDDNFVDKLNCHHILHGHYEYPYHVNHHQYVKIQSRARAAQNYIWDNYGDDGHVYVFPFSIISNDAQLARISEIGNERARRS